MLFRSDNIHFFFPILNVAREDAMRIVEGYEKRNEYYHLMSTIQEKLKENNEYVD